MVQQLKHLATYPYIQQKVAEGKLVLSGWYYVIETGEIFVYDKDTGEFVLLNDSALAKTSRSQRFSVFHSSCLISLTASATNNPPGQRGTATNMPIVPRNDSRPE